MWAIPEYGGEALISQLARKWRAAPKDGVGFFVVGAVTFFFGAWQGIEAFCSSSWPFVKGEVLSSTVETGRDNSAPRGGGASFKGEARYRYSVSGVSYHNDVVRIGQVSTGSSSRAKETARRHPHGPAKIYYDPANPQNAVLEPGVYGDVLVIPGVGLLFAIVGVVIIARGKPRGLFTRDP